MVLLTGLMHTQQSSTCPKAVELRASGGIEDFDIAWTKAISLGMLRSPLARGDGRSVECGLRLDGNSQPAWFAIDAVTGETVEARIDQRRLTNGFDLMLNEPRGWRKNAGVALRPGKHQGPSRLVHQCQFGCADPAKAGSVWGKPTLALTRCAHRTWSAIGNASPIDSAGHGILLPCLEREGAEVAYPHLPQRLGAGDVADFLEMSRRARRATLFYNHTHAGATAFHKHMQVVFWSRSRLPIEEAELRRIGCLEVLSGYPAAGIVLDFATGLDWASSLLWRAVRGLQSRSIPYNLIARNHRAYLIARDANHEVVPEFRSGVLACAELAGMFVTSSADVFADLAVQHVETAMRKTTLSLPDLLTAIDVH